MALLIQTIYDGYRDLMDNKSDPRVNGWFLMSSPFPTLAICLFYAYFVKVLGPKLMENRKPFDLRKVMTWYNLLQVIFSIWLFNEALVAWGGRYSLKCEPVDYSDNPISSRIARSCWWYYIAKFTEFIDTFFFVLRKKNNQISTLHVVHHGCMPMSVWFGVKFTPGGHSTFFGFVNTFVHIIMYSYYFLSAIGGPRIQSYLWWKKYLTTLQMVQFVIVMIHAFQLFFIDCNYPKAFVWWIGMHAFMFYVLFRSFYIQTYKKQKSKDLKEDKPTVQTGVQNNANNENKLIYADQYKMATGYISDSGLRNRVFIDNRVVDE